LSDPPASSKQTVNLPLSDSLFASADPADPAPTTT
jgi:hypothetical protein